MTKHEFLLMLANKLRQRNVEDVEDIVQEYEEHFTFKCKEGYGEEEIAAKLGDPETIAAQYDSSSKPAQGGKGLKIIAGVGLAFVDVVSFPFLAALYAFSAVLAGLAATGLAVSGSYASGLNPYGILPPMPYHCALIAAVTMLALAALSLIGVYFWTGLVTQIVKAYLRYRRNFMAAASGSGRMLPVPVRIQTPPKVWRVLRKALLVSLCVFCFGFVLTYAVCAVTAGGLGWWHIWNWFGGGIS